MWYKEIKQTSSLLAVTALVDCALEKSLLAETSESRFLIPAFLLVKNGKYRMSSSLLSFPLSINKQNNGIYTLTVQERINYY